MSSAETAGITPKWGDWRAYLKALKMIVDQPTEFYRSLARGVAYASSKYGGQDYALAFGGNEMPGYHTGPAAHVGYLVGARHSHLDGAGYSVDQKFLKQNRSPTAEEVAEQLLAEESWRQILSSLVVCFFARGIYEPSLVVEALRSVGYRLTVEDLKTLGLEILRRKNRLKLREGFKPEQLKFPKRIFETPTPLGNLDEGLMKEATKLFFNKLGLQT